MFEIPVVNLSESDQSFMVRNINEDFVKGLIDEIKNNPLVFFEPLICCVVDVLSSDDFFTASLSDYKYATIGGNHRRKVLQTLLAEGYNLPYKTIPSRLCFGKCFITYFNVGIKYSLYCKII